MTGPETMYPLTAAAQLSAKEKGCFLAAAATEPAAGAGRSKN